MQIRHGNTPPPDSATFSDRDTINLSIPTLGQKSDEFFPIKNSTRTTSGLFEIKENECFTFGFARARVSRGTDRATAEAIYNNLFETTADKFLYRIWNYLPELNEGTGDAERYKQFCEGRSNAFHAAFGDKDSINMPAGTCVGIDGDEIVIYFLAGSKSPDHHENPNQVPAYRYPRQYGPKGPSFARATSVHLDAKHYRFISGTAAVVGHESRGDNELEKQLEITCDNLDLVSKQTLIDAKPLKCNETNGYGKVYLRHAEDFNEAQRFLGKRLPELEPSFIYLRSDICRKELLVEIELLLIDS